MQILQSRFLSRSMLEFCLYSKAGISLFVSSLLASNAVKPFINLKKSFGWTFFFSFCQEEQKTLAVIYSLIRVVLLLYRSSVSLSYEVGDAYSFLSLRKVVSIYLPLGRKKTFKLYMISYHRKRQDATLHMNILTTEQGNQSNFLILA